MSKTNEMNEKEKQPSERPKVARRAREFADASDRLFVSVAQGIGRIGGWAYREAGDVAESAVASVAQPTEPRRRRVITRPPPARRGASEPAPGPKRVAARPSQPPSEDVGRGADLLSATAPEPPDEDTNELQSEREPMWPSAEQSAGVVPLVRALGNVVGEYSAIGYRELDRDERFWKLLNLIWLLTDSWAVDDESRTDDSSEPVGPEEESKESAE